MTMRNVELGMRNGVLLALIAVVCAACSMNSEPPVSGGGGSDISGLTAVRFASDAIAPAQSRVAGPARVAGTNWENNDAIGVYMVNHGTTAVAESATNIKYKTTDTVATAGFSAVTTAQTIYYPVNGSAVDFIAYYPHQDGVTTGGVYTVDVSTTPQDNQASQTAIDLMWSGVVNNSANGSNGYTKADASTPVTLPFSHQLVKLELTVIKDDSITSLTGMTVTIKGMKTTGSFNVSTGGALTNEGGDADITPKDMGSNKYEAILLPVTTLGTGHKITFLVGGVTYTWNLSGAGGITGGKLEAGKKYTYTVTVKKHAVIVQGTINSWGTGVTGGTGTVE